ncbi:hypothetical protein CDL12_16670 [Handroanthus impetiginosus]|uniref:Uncharacterized protein n=1 Tax=Handroanthus impetiginosus TaxID=429701 RepID=A0A2G9GZN2_9LAMI|nr:hypothetical protein CDL12_16670 [Handroanthus impetiginosus]
MMITKFDLQHSVVHLHKSYMKNLVYAVSWHFNSTADFKPGLSPCTLLQVLWCFHGRCKQGRLAKSKGTNCFLFLDPEKSLYARKRWNMLSK